MGQHGNINIKDFDYFLSEEKIARFPLKQRDGSKLLVYNQKRIRDDVFLNLCDHIPESSLLFRNNTKVIHARLIFKKKTGAQIEIFCLTPVDPAEYQLSFSQTQTCTWNCMVGNLKKWKDEILELPLIIDGIETILYAEKLELTQDKVNIKFTWNGEISFGKLLDCMGKIPIPPYLNRESENIDNERYQTVYSNPDGSVAAPTAGLHFTPTIFDSLLKKNIKPYDLTLHVGAGTFQPVKAANALDHKMHIEYFSIEKPVVELLAESNETIVATGTTTLRTLESLYWIAVKSIAQDKIHFNLEQWDNIHLRQDISRKEAFTGLLKLMQKTKMNTLKAGTGIMIIPGYSFKVVDGLITNFHQPQSTLLLLVAAFIGDKWKELYQHAEVKNYRFLSYGDSSILWR